MVLSESNSLSLEETEYVLNLPYHLAKGFMANDLCEILTDFDFLQHKISSNKIQLLIEDYDLALKHNFKTHEIIKDTLKSIQNTIQMSANILNQDRNQLAGQLWGRLLSLDVPEIEKLLEQAHKSQKKPWLRPLRRSLKSIPDSLIRTLEVEKDQSEMTVVAITPSGHRAVCWGDGFLRIWDVNRAIILHTIKHDCELYPGDLLVTSDGLQAITNEYSTLKIWDIERGICLRSLLMDNQEGEIIKIGITKDDQIVFAASRFGLELWELNSGASLSKIPYKIEGYAVQSIIITPETKRIITEMSDDGYLHNLLVWDIEHGVKLFELKGHVDPITRVKTTPDGRYAISASQDATVRVWDLHQGKELYTLRGHNTTVNDIAMSPDGKLAVSASSDRTLKVWDLEKGTEIKTLSAHNLVVTSVALTLDAKKCISASIEGTLKLWNLDAISDLSALSNKSDKVDHSKSVSSVTITSNDEFAISTSIDETLTIWHLDKAVKILTFQFPCSGVPIDFPLAKSSGFGNVISPFSLHGIISVNVASDMQKIIAASFDQYLKILYLSDKLDVVNVITKVTKFICSTFKADSAPITAVTTTPNSKYAISGSAKGTIKVWDLRSRQELYTLDNTSEEIVSLAVSLDGKYVFSATRSSVKIWNLKKRILEDNFDSEHQIITVLATGCGAVIVISRLDEEIHELSLNIIEQGKMKIYEISGSFLVNASAIGLDERYLIATSNNGRICILDVFKNRVISTFYTESRLNSCAISSDGMNIVAGDELCGVHFLRLEGIN